MERESTGRHSIAWALDFAGLVILTVQAVPQAVRYTQEYGIPVSGGPSWWERWAWAIGFGLAAAGQLLRAPDHGPDLWRMIRERARSVMVGKRRTA